MRELDPLVSEYQHDKHRPREAEALLMLRKIASLVKPIMRQRSWRVGTLCEFYPHQRNLLGLNVNAGQKICLRLRYPSDERQFLPLEQVVDTMLHELCHIVHGPHNQQFHALWNQLRDEHEELAIKGYTGEGFLSQGKRLGGRNMPIDEARRVARAAAERRRTLSAGSGQRLGGAPVLRGTDLRRIIADAAQRRIEVTEGCASGADNSVDLAEEASRNGFRTKAEEDDANERAIMEAYIDLIQQEEREKYGPSYILPSQEIPAGPRSAPSPPPVPASTKPTPSQQPLEPIDLTSDNTSYEQPWTCPTCTLENPANFLCCDACTSERPRPSATRSSSGPATTSSNNGGTRSTKNKRPISQTASETLFKNRTRAAETLAALDSNIAKRPLGWVCNTCGTFMETSWWTCSNCGMMKQAS
ncbi:metalloendopeptidase WSS1 [Aspergillus clavatus NRRL 1]|uniref:Zinc metallopeptidase, putative n=1 Tax=Aspergillus clavatus (strain ATCC 1007 / CBS 513.65 / DSM 816 / NCTC 3887 / NRRL 1 / QM 1276 / 107) TaxID=344612 RepID=A1CS16_ASPCL|nr:zinc metallopeptidase, putative [Aspergillus clavatus NRRL 1]EAW08437.1 zinc metallopeptidase, putative [Aspergillus clavatus NRRL 1]